MKKIFIILPLFLLSGCFETLPTKTSLQIASTIVEQTYVLPEFTKCKSRPKLQTGKLSEFEDKWDEFNDVFEDCERRGDLYEQWIIRNHTNKKEDK